MSYIVRIELEDWEQLHTVVDRLTGEITEFEQDFIDLTRAKLVERYNTPNGLPNVPLKSLPYVFDNIIHNYEEYMLEKKTNVKT